MSGQYYMAVCAQSQSLLYGSIATLGYLCCNEVTFDGTKISNVQTPATCIHNTATGSSRKLVTYSSSAINDTNTNIKYMYVCV